MSTISPTAMPGGFETTDLERLKTTRPTTPEQEKARLRKAAEEFESLFMYQMLTSMRKTIGENPLAKDAPMTSGLGKDTFMDMFDIHLARRMVTGGEGSIADILYNRLVKTIETAEPGEMQLQPLRPSNERAPIRIDRRDLPLEQPGRRPVPIEDDQRKPLPIRSAPRPVSPQSPIRQRYGPLIDEAAETHKVDSALIEAVIQKESAGDPKAVSPAGAKGLMQLMDATAADLGVSEVFDERENIMSGTRYLRRMLDRFGDIRLALAAYNAGPGTVERYGDLPPYEETRKYVENVISLATSNGMRIEVDDLKPDANDSDN